jgi:hypothetical protein
MRSRQEKIIGDLLALFAKYDSAEIESAVQSLRTGEALRLVAELATEFAKLPRDTPADTRSRTPANRARTARDFLNHSIAEFLTSDNAVHRELGEVLEAARDGKILRSSAVMHNFIVSVGLHIPLKKDRASTLNALGKHISELSDEEIAKILPLAKDTGRQESSLQRWSDIIVHKKKS